MLCVYFPVTCDMVLRRRQSASISPRYVNLTAFGQLSPFKFASSVDLDRSKHASLKAGRVVVVVLIVCRLYVWLDRIQAFKLHDRLFTGLVGLASDIQTVEQLLQFRLNLYRLREER